MLYDQLTVFLLVDDHRSRYHWSIAYREECDKNRSLRTNQNLNLASRRLAHLPYPSGLTRASSKSEQANLNIIDATLLFLINASLFARILHRNHCHLKSRPP